MDILKRMTIALFGGLIILLMSKIVKPKSEILDSDDVPDFWPKKIRFKKDDFDLTTNIYYTETFMKTMDKLSESDREEVKNKITNAMSSDIKPYTKLYDQDAQPIKRKSKVKKIIERMWRDDAHEDRLPKGVNYRKIRHKGTDKKIAYWVHENQPKSALIGKLDRGEQVVLSMYLIGYGSHKYCDG